jgi:hypothetical protein
MTYIVKLGKLLLNAQVHVAVLIQTFLNHFSPSLATFADSLHLEFHLR